MLFDIANGCARVSIADNGCGLSRTTSLDDAGNGLTSMRNRAGELGGELRVESTPGKGVRIEVTFPVRAGLRPNKVAGEA
jgi:signal transduction histidine kinase